MKNLILIINVSIVLLVVYFLMYYADIVAALIYTCIMLVFYMIKFMSTQDLLREEENKAYNYSAEFDYMQKRIHNQRKSINRIIVAHNNMRDRYNEREKRIAYLYKTINALCNYSNRFFSVSNTNNSFNKRRKRR